MFAGKAAPANQKIIMVNRNLLVFFAFAILRTGANAEIVTFPAAEGMDPSVHYTIKAGGKDVIGIRCTFCILRGF